MNRLQAIDAHSVTPPFNSRRATPHFIAPTSRKEDAAREAIGTGGTSSGRSVFRMTRFSSPVDARWGSIFVDCCSLFFYVGFKFFCGMAEGEQRLVVSNRKARHNYQIVETLEAGIMLHGTEVKSLRGGNANLLDSYALIKKGEVWLFGMHISPYSHGNLNNHDPLRTRKLLIQKKQIRKLIARVAEQGLSLIPLSIYFKGPYAKVELAIARGKKSFDKREAIKEREAKRHVARSLKRSLT